MPNMAMIYYDLNDNEQAFQLFFYYYPNTNFHILSLLFQTQIENPDFNWVAFIICSSECKQSSHHSN